MKKLLGFCLIMILTSTVYADTDVRYSFGDYRSTTLVTKAWEALDKKNLEAVVVYANKCIKLYAKQARGMQSYLKDYHAGSNDDIFKYWALNDVGTALFILGEAYRIAGKNEEAIQAYKELINEYFYAQCWDTKGWFWKPAPAAQKRIIEVENAS